MTECLSTKGKTQAPRGSLAKRVRGQQHSQEDRSDVSVGRRSGPAISGAIQRGGVLPLGWVALVHVAAAFALILFLIVHIYLAATTGKPWYSYLRAMFTDGYEEVG